MSLTSDLRQMARDIRALGRGIERAQLVALDRTARDVGDAEVLEIRDSFDRPNPYTLRAVRVRNTQNRVPEATVSLKDDNAGARGQATYLDPQIRGGGRPLKAFERALRSIGAMDGSQYVVPGRYARLDAYGNISRGQILQILSQLRAFTGVETVSRNLVRRDGTRGAGSLAATAAEARKLRTRAFRRAGGQYFVVSSFKRGGLRPGVYQRQVLGARTAGPADRRPRAVMIFVDRARYERRFDFYGAADLAAERAFPQRLDEALRQFATPRSA